MWKITDTMNRETTIKDLQEEFPNLIALDESAWNVDLYRIEEDPKGLADAGISTRSSRRILFWASEKDSIDDDGSEAVAVAVWEEPEIHINEWAFCVVTGYEGHDVGYSSADIDGWQDMSDEELLQTIKKCVEHNGPEECLGVLDANKVLLALREAQSAENSHDLHIAFKNLATE